MQSGRHRICATSRRKCTFRIEYFSLLLIALHSLTIECQASSYSSNNNGRHYRQERDSQQPQQSYGQQDEYRRREYPNDEHLRRPPRRNTWEESSSPPQQQQPYQDQESVTSYSRDDGVPPRPEQQFDPSRVPPSRDAVGNPYATSSRTPIHYQFQTPKRPLESIDARNDDLPQTTLDIDESLSRPLYEKGDRDDEEGVKRRDSASPRNDAVTRYMSTKRGRVLLTLSSGTVGAAVGGFVGKSLINSPKPLMVAMFFVMALCTNILRNAYGELSRALGLALIFAVQRFVYIRKRYPTVRHIKACLRAGPRRNFPPADNPWNYNGDEVHFRMLQTAIAMAFVGSICGGNMPLIPKWMGGMAGAGALGFSTTLRNSQGDLARTMGMRVVALAEEVLDINAELNLLRNMGTVGGKVLDKLLILDRKHRIKDRLVAGFQWIYNQASRTAEQVQSDMQGGGGEGPDRESEGLRGPPREGLREPDDRSSSTPRY